MSFRIASTSLIAATIAVMPGCSLLIANSGKTLPSLESREVVVKQFGTPDRIDKVDLVRPGTGDVYRFDVENYHVRGNYNTGMPCGAGGPILLLLDPWLTCVELYETAQEYVTGYDLAFVYDEDGNTIGYDYPQPLLQKVRTTSDLSTNVLNWERYVPESVDASAK